VHRPFSDGKGPVVALAVGLGVADGDAESVGDGDELLGAGVVGEADEESVGSAELDVVAAVAVATVSGPALKGIDSCPLEAARATPPVAAAATAAVVRILAANNLVTSDLIIEGLRAVDCDVRVTARKHATADSSPSAVGAVGAAAAVSSRCSASLPARSGRARIAQAR
jgi:hypothetical protein